MLLIDCTVPVYCRSRIISSTVSRQLPQRKIAPPPVRVRVWVSFRVGGQLSSGAIVPEPNSTKKNDGFELASITTLVLQN